MRFAPTMKSIRKTLPLLAAVLTLVCAAFAQEGPLSSHPPKGLTPDEIIQQFAAKEKDFKQAREQYTFRPDVRVQTVDGSTVTGKYREVFDVTYDFEGKHLEN